MYPLIFCVASTPVLIETYWNVKDIKKFAYAVFPVLIETYWNVKGIGKEYYDSHAKY